MSNAHARGLAFRVPAETVERQDGGRYLRKMP